MPQQQKDVPPVRLQGAVCHQSLQCRASVMWNILYIPSTGILLLINWVYVDFTFQDPNRGENISETLSHISFSKAPRQMCCAAWWNQCECANWQHNQLSVIIFMKYERFHVLIQNMPAFWVCALTGKPWLCHKQELIDDSLQATQGHAPFCCRLSKNISDIWKSKRDFVSPRPS